MFECPATCSQAFVRDGRVTILRESLQMHYHGRSGPNQVTRDGHVAHEATVDFYDYDQRGNQEVVQAPYKVSSVPGRYVSNHLSLQCDDSIHVGPESSDEMCNASLLHYPLKVLSEYG